MAAPNIVTPNLQRGFAVLSIAVTPAAAAAGVSSQTFTVNGVLPGDFIGVNSQVSPGTGVAITGAYASAANTITVTYDNQSGASATPAADTYLVFIARSHPVQTDFGITKFNNIGIVAGANP